MFSILVFELIIVVVYTTNYIVKKEYHGEMCGGDYQSLSIDKFNDCDDEDGKSYKVIEGNDNNITYWVYSSSEDCTGSYAKYGYKLDECVMMPTELEDGDDQYVKFFITTDPVQYAKDNTAPGLITQMMHTAGVSPKPSCGSSFSSASTLFSGMCFPFGEDSYHAFCDGNTEASQIGFDKYSTKTCTGTMAEEKRITNGNCTSLYYPSIGYYLYMTYYFNCSKTQEFVAYSSYKSDDTTCSGNITDSQVSQSSACWDRVDDGIKSYRRYTFNDSSEVDVKNYGAKDCKNPTTSSTTDLNSCKLVNGEYHYFEKVEDPKLYMSRHIPYGKLAGSMVGFSLGETRSTECMENVVFGGRSFEVGFCENDISDGGISMKIFKGCTPEGKVRIKQYSQPDCNDCNTIHDDYVDNGGCFGLKGDSDMYFYCRGWFNQSVCDYGEPIEDAPCATSDAFSSVYMMHLFFVFLLCLFLL